MREIERERGRKERSVREIEENGEEVGLKKNRWDIRR